MASTKVQRIMTQPINLIFRFLQSKARIQIWLFEQKDLRIEGRIIGFDEYMNLVLDDAEEINVQEKTLGNHWAGYSSKWQVKVLMAGMMFGARLEYVTLYSIHPYHVIVV
ncbi:unnamed protein product [Miscanthus lutarioriparius]|uniref:Small nuclear ribonucleoprotein E n=1 Tax=Miscanthus lutarioriparius TaxID=422564 RepID=A0A811SKL4_9POAL|nr:unnamed protein product [Miscanthus lutarioriparius]